MGKIFKKIRNFFFARLSIIFAALWPSSLSISLMRKLNKIQISPEQLKVIAMTVKQKAPCKLLIFGVGNDSAFWSNLNRGGVTIFLEHNKDWLQKVSKKSKNLTVFLVNYDTQIKDWMHLLEHPSLLNMDLPTEVEKKAWDVILVDAPDGWHDKTPGRMKSIFLSSRLIENSGDIFVHDCNREVEDIYCNRFLGKENLKIELKAPGGLLRHYHITKKYRA